jgi:hypothetical protein
MPIAELPAHKSDNAARGLLLAATEVEWADVANRAQR